MLAGRHLRRQAKTGLGQTAVDYPLFSADAAPRRHAAFAGPRGCDAKRALITATRCLGGLRPKDAVPLILQGLASTGGSGHLLAVSNARHVINQRRRKRRRMMHADMDNYWVERGGEPAALFGFRVPIRSIPAMQGANRREHSKMAFWRAGNWLLSRPACPE